MGKHNVILDVDTGIDDAIAIILAALSDKINLIAISVVAGNTSLDKAYKNTKRVLHLLDMDIPLIKGYAKPLYRDLDLAEDTHGDDGLGGVGHKFDQAHGLKFESYQGPQIEDFYSEIFHAYDDLNIVAVGPLTNIQAILAAMPEKFARTKRFISMGGSYKSHGNCSPVAEFNYWADPEGADFVYKTSPIKIEMVGLDVTRQIVLDDSRLEKIKGLNLEIGTFMEEITGFYYGYHLEKEGLRGCVINDPLAVACLIDDELLTGFESYTRIASQGLARGQSIVDDHDFYKEPANSIIYSQVDVERFFDIFNQAVTLKNGD